MHPKLGQRWQRLREEQNSAVNSLLGMRMPKPCFQFASGNEVQVLSSLWVRYKMSPRRAEARRADGEDHGLPLGLGNVAGRNTYCYNLVT